MNSICSDIVFASVSISVTFLNFCMYIRTTNGGIDIT